MTTDDTLTEASAFSDISVRQAAYAHIRGEIASGSTEAIKLSWRRRHNELSLISRLPPEVLSIVFTFVAELAASVGWALRAIDSIHISHVCGYWRLVALDCPYLWTQIPFFLLNWAEEMLVRSKQAPLTIVAVLGQYSLQERLLRHNAVLKTALAQLSRVKALSLTDVGHHGEEESMLIGHLSSPAPLLESLVIEFNFRSDRNKLPENLFMGEAPRLTHLNITRCGLNWRAPIFTHLRSLRFVTDHLAPVWIKPPGNQFFPALSTMRQLETLEFLSNFTPTRDEISDEMVVDLPRLAQLTVGHSFEHCAFLLHHISYPNTTRVRILCNMHHFSSVVEPADMQKLVEDLTKRIQGPIRSLAVREYGIQVWSPGISPNNPLVPADLDLQVSQGFSDGVPGAEILTSILQPLQLDHLESLMVHLIYPNRTVWLDYFGNLSQLKDIHVVLDATGFLHAFSKGTARALRKKSASAAGLKFKALRKLTLSSWTFDGMHSFDGSHMTEKSCVETLKDCLRARRRAGIPLSELVVDECFHVEEDDVDQLWTVVENVDWDGDSGYTTAESTGESEQNDDEGDGEFGELDDGDAEYDVYDPPSD